MISFGCPKGLPARRIEIELACCFVGRNRPRTHRGDDSCNVRRRFLLRVLRRALRVEATSKLPAQGDASEFLSRRATVPSG